MTLLQFYLDCVAQQHINAIINYLKFNKKLFIHDKLQFKLSFMSSLNVMRTLQLKLDVHRQLDALKKFRN